jgi:hypothetical protein
MDNYIFIGIAVMVSSTDTVLRGRPSGSQKGSELYFLRFKRHYVCYFKGILLKT